MQCLILPWVTVRDFVVVAQERLVAILAPTRRPVLLPARDTGNHSVCVCVCVWVCMCVCVCDLRNDSIIKTNTHITLTTQAPSPPNAQSEFLQQELRVFVNILEVAYEYGDDVAGRCLMRVDQDGAQQRRGFKKIVKACSYTRSHTCTHTHTYSHTYLHARAHTHILTHTRAHTHILTHTHTHAHTPHHQQMRSVTHQRSRMGWSVGRKRRTVVASAHRYPGHVLALNICERLPFCE